MDLRFCLALRTRRHRGLRGHSRHPSELFYPCAVPHSGQNLAPRAMDLPQLTQNLVAAAALSPGFIAFITCWAMARPAPRPTPAPAKPPPPSLAAAIGMELATWNCV